MRLAALLGGLLVVAVGAAWWLTHDRSPPPRAPRVLRASPSATATASASTAEPEAQSALEGVASSILYDVMFNDMGEEDAPFLEEQLAEAMALDRLGTVASRVRVARSSVADLLRRRAGEPTLEGELSPLQERAIEQEGKRWARSMVQALKPDDDRPRVVDGYRRVPWRTLTGFDFEAGMTLPEEVRALDGRRVALDGYMIITAWSDDRRVEEFLLTESMWGCCFARTPQIHEGVLVRAPRVKGHEGPVTVVGTLEVRERREDGEVTGIYRLEAHRVSALEP